MRTLELPVVYSNGEQIVHNLELCVTCRGDFEDWLRDPEVDHTPEGLRGTP